MSRFAISDIHGCLETFDALLDKIQLSTSDELYLLGDYIDRGPNSSGVIDRIMHLQQQSYQIHCLMGNHEEMAIDRYQRASYQNHGYSDEQFRWMMALKNYIEIPGYLLVHAGINFSVEDPLSDTNSLRWIRYWEEDLNKDWLGGRKVVYGHTPQSYQEVVSQVKTLDHTSCVCIDAGCAFQARGLGYLVALDLDETTVHPMRRIDIV